MPNGWRTSEIKKKEKRNLWQTCLGEIPREAIPARRHPGPQPTFPPSKHPLNPSGPDGLQEESLRTKPSQKNPEVLSPRVTVTEAGKREFCNQICSLTPKGRKRIVEGRCFTLQHPKVLAGGARRKPSAPRRLGDEAGRTFPPPAGCELQPGPGQPGTRACACAKGPPTLLVFRCARASGRPSRGGNSIAGACAFQLSCSVREAQGFR